MAVAKSTINPTDMAAQQVDIAAAHMPNWIAEYWKR